jgi:hypothetical protein
MDFEELGIDSNQIPNFYKSDFGRWFKRLKDSVPFEVRREEALNLLKKITISSVRFSKATKFSEFGSPVKVNLPFWFAM